MVITTKTISQIHLEDLEPHRFEDLVRQLLYDFKQWQQLEATGRSGSDDGFDARGWEKEIDVDVQAEDEAGENEELPERGKGRLWLIQCKRENAIGPTKIKQYVNDIPQEERNNIYGVIFAAACDFSKKSRDAFFGKCREFGFGECYLWGKGEIEDMLFQPKNDHLLFAYFGFSLQVRQRSLKNQVRSRLATKKKVKKCIGDYQDILIRDASDDRYPYLDNDKNKGRMERGRWKIFRSDGSYHNGLHVIIERYYAFIDVDGVSWDFAEDFDQSKKSIFNDPWDGKDRGKKSLDEQKIFSFWQALPEANRAWYEVFAILPYDNILAIDEDGDEWTEQTPHVYTTNFDIKCEPFSEGFFVKLQSIGKFDQRSINPDPEKRIKKFPKKRN